MHHVEIEVTMRVNGRLVRREQSAYSTDVLNEATLVTGLEAAGAVRELNQRMNDELLIRQLSQVKSAEDLS